MATASDTTVLPISLDRVYAWTFPQKFSQLNGTYRVISILTFSDALTSDVDFFKNLYQPAGLTQDQYNADASGYAGQIVYQLQSPSDTTALSIYVPSSLITVAPDPSVTEYVPIYVAVPLGIFKSSAEYAFILPEIDALAAAVTGDKGTCRFFGKSEAAQWLTNAQYDAQAAARAAKVIATNSLSTQNQSLQKVIDAQGARIAALEEIIRTSKASITSAPATTTPTGN